MKCTKLIFTLLIIMTVLAGCIDFHMGKRPIDYENTKWVSQSPDMFFEVGGRKKVTYAQIIIDGDVVELICWFDYGAGISFYPFSALTPSDVSHPYDTINGDEWLFLGTCTFRSDKLIVKIFNNRFLDDSIKEIVFVREDM